MEKCATVRSLLQRTDAEFIVKLVYLVGISFRKILYESY